MLEIVSRKAMRNINGCIHSLWFLEVNPLRHIINRGRIHSICFLDSGWPILISATRERDLRYSISDGAGDFNVFCMIFIPVPHETSFNVVTLSRLFSFSPVPAPKAVTVFVFLHMSFNRFSDQVEKSARTQHATYLLIVQPSHGTRRLVRKNDKN